MPARANSSNREREELFANAEWKRFVAQAKEAEEALVASLVTLNSLYRLGRAQGHIEQLRAIINYEHSMSIMDSWQDEEDAEALEL